MATRGRLPGPRTYDRKYQLCELAGRHKEITRLHTLGWNNKQIARELGITPQSVSICLNSRVGKYKLDDLEERRDAETVDMKNRITKVQTKAQQFLEKVLESDEALPSTPTLEQQIRVARFMLEQGGNGPIRRTQEQRDVRVFSSEDIDEIKQMAKMYEVLDAEYTVDESFTDGQPGVAEGDS